MEAPRLYPPETPFRVSNGLDQDMENIAFYG